VAPRKTAVPGKPCGPVAPVRPVGPLGPVVPIGPAGPAGPSVPGEPSTPSVPGEPLAPVAPTCAPWDDPFPFEFESFAPLGIETSGPKATWKGTAEVPGPRASRGPAEACSFWARAGPLRTMEDRGAFPLRAEGADVALSRKATAPTATAAVSGTMSQARRSGNAALPGTRSLSRNPCMLAMNEGSVSHAGIRSGCRMKVV
jgi:hypothetical protein